MNKPDDEHDSDTSSLPDGSGMPEAQPELGRTTVATPSPTPDSSDLPDPVGAADPPDGARIAGRWMITILIWGFAIVGGSIAVQHWLDAREAARAPRISVDAGGHSALELTADRRGHYSLTAMINGMPVDFLVDTGASSVAIPQSVADRLGLERGRPEPVSTANGMTLSWSTTIDELQAGPLRRRDVDASITPGMEGDQGLLGMSFLRHFDLTQRDGVLIVRDPAARR